MDIERFKCVERFTGLFIPSDILRIKELDSRDIMVLAWIDCFYDKEYDGCLLDNLQLAEKIRIGKDSISKNLTKLRQLNLIEDIYLKGNVRMLRILRNNIIKYRV